MITENKLSGQEIRISSEICFLFLWTSDPHLNVCPFLTQKISILDCLVGISFQIAMQIVMVLCLPGAPLDFCTTAY